MKEFIIKEIVINNFKGQSRTFTPNDVKTFVKGANGVGKNNVIQGFLLVVDFIHRCIECKKSRVVRFTFGVDA